MSANAIIYDASCTFMAMNLKRRNKVILQTLFTATLFMVLLK